MKQILLLLILFPACIYCQQDSVTANNTKQKKEQKPHNSIGFGIKAGLNFTNVTSASSVSNSSETGYHVGLFLDPSSKSILGSRTELLYSHQAYNFANGNTTGTNYLDYIMLAQLMVINITHFFQIQVGTQIGYLLSAKTDSNKVSTGYAQADAALSYYNRFIFGFSGGLEVRPFMGIIAGARYNLSLTNLYKIPDVNSSSQTPPSFIPSTSDVNFKNNLIQVYVGYRF
ncbi:MAG TPA: porin family protein [Puia sp.]|nr:porin family protein [Puia sp.]